MSLPADLKFSLLSSINDAVANEPAFARDVIEAAVSGQRLALERANARRADLERAWVSALLLLNADRITPGLKKMLSASLLPVLEHYSLERECKAVRDAHAKLSSEASQ